MQGWLGAGRFFFSLSPRRTAMLAPAEVTTVLKLNDK